MVAVFGRSLSFNPSRPSTPKPPISQHTRSISLPCRSHPLTSLLQEKTSHIHSWLATKPPNPSNDSAWLVDGLSRLKDLLDCLDDTLQLPRTKESLLRRRSSTVEKLLDDFLRLVDAYGTFQALVLSLKEEQSAADVAIRRRDVSKAVVCVEARRRLGKEMRSLISAVRCVKIGRLDSGAVCVGDDGILEAICHVASATVVVSVAVFDGIAKRRELCSCYNSRISLLWMKKNKREKIKDNDETTSVCLVGLREKSDEEIKKASKKMQDLEASFAGIESCAGKVFRGLITARVSLLNAFTH